MLRTTSRNRLALEPLEARETPAGVVDIGFRYGSFSLTGDAENNIVANSSVTFPIRPKTDSPVPPSVSHVMGFALLAW